MTLVETGEMGEGAEEGRTKAVAIEGEATSSRLRWLITLICSVSDRRVYYVSRNLERRPMSKCKII